MKLVAVILIFFSLNSHANCPIYFHSESLCSDISWINGPLLGKKSHFKLSFWRAGDSEMKKISPRADVKIFSWMTMSNGHDHGGPKMTATERTPGVFEVEDARFFMHGMNGFWEIVIELIKNGNTIDSHRERLSFD
tara:strand:+ start:183 stop:590 length:408 start_codon:yes stop_codon:yes gene_type:complete